MQADGDSFTSDIYFYTHWSGSNVKQTVQRALGRKQRWSDGSYLARIIFCELVKGNEGEETGFGISSVECDNEHPIVYVNVKEQTVTVDGQKFTFHQFVAHKFDNRYARTQDED